MINHPTLAHAFLPDHFPKLRMCGIAFPKTTQQCQECAPAQRFIKAAQEEKKRTNILS